MAERVFTLAYVSTVTEPFTLIELIELTEECQIRNKAIGVTGILVYREPTVIQILEGDPRTVWQLYTSIARDPRHRDVAEMWSERLGGRRYPDWSMNLITDGQLYDLLGAGFTADSLHAAVSAA